MALAIIKMAHTLYWNQLGGFGNYYSGTCIEEIAPPIHNYLFREDFDPEKKLKRLEGILL